MYTEMPLFKSSKAGGCGCKAPLEQLNEFLGESTGDAEDAVVSASTPFGHRLISTIDVGGPIVPFPEDWGAISLAHAVSDIYAMGGVPLLALCTAGLVADDLVNTEMRIAFSAAKKFGVEIGVPILGGHTTVGSEPSLGFCIIGSAPPEAIRKKSDARVGDAIIITKPIGIGIYASALRLDALPRHAYNELLEVTKAVNSVGSELGLLESVHALTDVTGFGVIGHCAEVADASQVSLVLTKTQIPKLMLADEFAREGYVPALAYHTLASLQRTVHGIEGDASDTLILADPQTSGGLLLTCESSMVSNVLDLIRRAGFASACRIGTVIPRNAYSVIVK